MELMMTDRTGFDGAYEDDDEECEHCMECHALEALTENGIQVATQWHIFNQDEFMEVSLPELDRMRDEMVVKCLYEFKSKGLTPISTPACRWRSIDMPDGQPSLIQFHVSIFGLRMLRLTDEAADRLELRITERIMAERDDTE